MNDGLAVRRGGSSAPFFREGTMKIAQPDLGRAGVTEGLRIDAISTCTKKA